MSKRIKSALITVSSIVFTAFVTVTFTPEWGTFLTYLHDKAASFGIPAAVIAVVGVLLSEVWKEILNRRKLEAAREDFGAAVVRDARNIDLY